MPILYFHNGKERTVIGTLDVERKIFSKKVQKSKHLHRVTNSYGTDANYFTKVLLPGEYTLKFTDIESKIRYTVTAKKFSEQGVYMHFKSNGKDFGSQIFLPLEHWDKESYETNEEQKAQQT